MASLGLNELNLPVSKEPWTAYLFLFTENQELSDANFVVSGGTKCCPYDNYPCQQWWQSWHHDNSRASMFRKASESISLHDNFNLWNSMKQKAFVCAFFFWNLIKELTWDSFHVHIFCFKFITCAWLIFPSPLQNNCNFWNLSKIKRRVNLSILTHCPLGDA